MVHLDQLQEDILQVAAVAEHMAQALQAAEELAAGEQ
jgi:hypothetical protein